MLNIKDFIKKQKLPITWTIGYVFVVWAILHILFNFELFSINNWIRVSHAHLHGVGGAAFCLIVLAAIPLYVATMTIIIRTQKTLFSIPVPKFIKNIFEKLFSKPTPEKTESENTETPTQPQTTETPGYAKYPAEMRGAFIRAQSHPNRIATPICSACSVNPNVYPDTQNNEPTLPSELANEMPLPPDFDSFDKQLEDPQPLKPIFQDINFYDDDEPTIEPENNPNLDTNVLDHLKKTNREYNIINNDFILTSDMIIATHNDTEFWIMDDPIWFAAGKTRPSPIEQLLSNAQEHSVKPVFVLTGTNIMDFENKRKEWEAAGITVITDLADL